MENGQRETDYRETANDDQINNGGYTENPFENMEDGLCKRCRCRTIDRSENPESILCRDCREELIRLKIPHLFYLIGAVVILLAALTFATSMKGLNNLSGTGGDCTVFPGEDGGAGEHGHPSLAHRV